MPTGDNPEERQPFFGIPNRNNRIYVPAEFAPSGTWIGSPKISGGFEISKGTAVDAPRGLNRVDQRYTQAASTMQANRASRGLAEYDSMNFLITELGRFEIQTASGKSVDAVPLASEAFLSPVGEPSMCQCEDDWRLRESGYSLDTFCKHVHALRKWLLDTTIDERFYSLEYVSEQTGYSLRALEEACREERIVAEKVGRQWGISPVVIEATLSYLLDRIVTFPNAIG